jgi:outer membrane protein OmpA-like peptidoglycan-associated protein
LVAEGDRYRIQTPVALGDEFFFAPDPATTVQPIRLMLSGPITIGHVHFTPGSAKLTDAGRIVLSEVAHQMKMSGLMGAYLVGNTDRSGSADMNLALSEKRAAKAAKYLNRALNNLGVVGANVTYESMGEYLSDSRDGVVDEFDRKVSIMIHPGL